MMTTPASPPPQDPHEAEAEKLEAEVVLQKEREKTWYYVWWVAIAAGVGSVIYAATKKAE